MNQLCIVVQEVQGVKNIGCYFAKGIETDGPVRTHNLAVYSYTRPKRLKDETLMALSRGPFYGEAVQITRNVRRMGRKGTQPFRGSNLARDAGIIGCADLQYYVAMRPIGCQMNMIEDGNRVNVTYTRSRQHQIVAEVPYPIFATTWYRDSKISPRWTL